MTSWSSIWRINSDKCKCIFQECKCQVNVWMIFRSRTSSLSTCASSNAHNSHTQPVSILKGTLTNVHNDCDKRNNNYNGTGHRPPSYNGSMSSPNLDEISSQGIDNEGLTITDQKPTVSFSSPIIESSDKASLLINVKKSFTKRGKSNKNIQGGTKINNNNDKRSVAFQNPLSGTSAASNKKHASVVSPEAYPPSQLTVTIFEEEAELRHAPWFQAGIPRYAIILVNNELTINLRQAMSIVHHWILLFSFLPVYCIFSHDDNEWYSETTHKHDFISSIKHCISLKIISTCSFLKFTEILLWMS